jgi:hypothetical protein
MDLLSAIEAFNAVSEPKIKLRDTFREGHTEATLPRVGRTINVKEGMTGINGPTAQDLAYLCQEARLAAEPGFALLSAALDAFVTIEGDESLT